MTNGFRNCGARPPGLTSRRIRNLGSTIIYTVSPYLYWRNMSHSCCDDETGLCFNPSGTKGRPFSEVAHVSPNIAPLPCCIIRLPGAPRSQVERAFDLSLRVFGEKHWEAERQTLAGAALGLIKASLPVRHRSIQCLVSGLRHFISCFHFCPEVDRLDRAATAVHLSAAVICVKYI